MKQANARKMPPKAMKEAMAQANAPHGLGGCRMARSLVFQTFSNIRQCLLIVKVYFQVFPKFLNPQDYRMPNNPCKAPHAEKPHISYGSVYRMITAMLTCAQKVTNCCTLHATQHQYLHMQAQIFQTRNRGNAMTSENRKQHRIILRGDATIRDFLCTRGDFAAVPATQTGCRRPLDSFYAQAYA